MVLYGAAQYIFLCLVQTATRQAGSLDDVIANQGAYGNFVPLETGASHCRLLVTRVDARCKRGYF